MCSSLWQREVGRDFLSIKMLRNLLRYFLSFPFMNFKGKVREKGYSPCPPLAGVGRICPLLAGVEDCCPPLAGVQGVVLEKNLYCSNPIPPFLKRCREGFAETHLSKYPASPFHKGGNIMGSSLLKREAGRDFLCFLFFQFLNSKGKD